MGHIAHLRNRLKQTTILSKAMNRLAWLKKEKYSKNHYLRIIKGRFLIQIRPFIQDAKICVIGPFV